MTLAEMFLCVFSKKSYFRYENTTNFPLLLNVLQKILSSFNKSRIKTIKKLLLILLKKLID